MSRIVDDEPPIKTHPANKAYRDNYDRIFGAKPSPLAAMPGATGGSGYTADEAIEPEPRVGTIANVVVDDWSGEPIVCHVQAHEDNTRMTCRNSGRAATLKDLDHHACYTCNKLYDACKRLP